MPKFNHRHRRGAVYAMTNAAGSNEIIAFSREDDGLLTRLNSYETGGSGTGEAVVDPLASQGSLILSQSGCFLLAVNAGSNSISSFRVADNGALTLADVEPSGGVRPNSLCVLDGLLYATNVGDPTNGIASNVTGFCMDQCGCLTRISGSTNPLSTPDAQPSCIVFSPDASQLVVSELNTNRLSVFEVQSDGTLAGPTVNSSNGAGPFGSVFLSTGILLVSEAGPNALSSYITEEDNILAVISGSVPNGQSATCWVASSRSEHFAFTSNAGSGTITTYRVDNDGMLAVADITYSTHDATNAPIDIGVSKDGCNFYVLNGNRGSISVFSITKYGQLIRLQVIRNTGLPTLGAQGLAVR